MKIYVICMLLFATLSSYYSLLNKTLTPAKVNEKPKRIIHLDTVIYNNKGFSEDIGIEWNWQTVNAFDTLHVGVVIYNQSDSLQEFIPVCDHGGFAPASDSRNVFIVKGKYGKVYGNYISQGFRYGYVNLRMEVFDKNESSYITRIYRGYIK